MIIANDTILDDDNLRYIKNKSIDGLIARSIKERPDDVCIIYGDTSITYNELDKRSNIIANSIIKKIGEEQHVAMIYDRSIESIITCLGIIKSRCVYIPIDPQYPEKRIENMIDDCKCKMIIIQSKYRYLTKVWGDKNIVIISYDEINEQSCNFINEYETTDDLLAYIIYTSGTTGKPKGVMISHEAILNTLVWMKNEFKISSEDVIAHKTSISFTDSIWEIFLPLVCGAKIKIINDNDKKDMQKLYEMLNGVTITQFVPSSLKVFMDYIERKNINKPLPELNWIFNGGEHLNINLANRWNRIFESAQIGNIYGMTESAVYATCYIVEKSIYPQSSKMPIGKPIANTKIFILNNNKICDINEVGEICISSISLSSGYWNMPEITDEKFHYSNICSERIYRTGDLGSFRPDGNIDYHGRMDEQVKIRGGRVELLEVEKNIYDLNDQGEISVISVKDKFDENILVCFYTNKLMKYKTVKSELSKILPDYMLPTLFLYTEELPKTSNGKVDKEKLRHIAVSDKSHNDCVDDASIVEQLTKIWKLLLPSTEFSPDCDFFDLGGDSLLLMRVQAMLEIIGINIEYDEMRQNTTINQLVKRINEDK